MGHYCSNTNYGDKRAIAWPNKETIFQSLPLLIVIIFISWMITSSLTRPINRLVKFSEISMKNNQPLALNPENNSHIYEVRKLYKQLQNHYQVLNNKIQEDGLTGLGNRRSFDFVMENWIKNKTPFTLIFIDIDHFKKFNDDYGHLVGDDVIKCVATTLKELTPIDSYCFRYGGEEFAITLKGDSLEDSYLFAEKLRKEIERQTSEAKHPITISLGVTSLEKTDQLPSDVIHRADAALYQSKREGRNRTTVFREVDA